jgi:hypothetical protein
VKEIKNKFVAMEKLTKKDKKLIQSKEEKKEDQTQPRSKITQNQKWPKIKKGHKSKMTLNQK